MSSSQASGIDPTSFDSILAAALDAYTKKTGVVLADDPFADALKGCRSAQSVIAQFEQIQKKVLGETTRRSGKRANAMGKLKVLVPVIVSLCDTLGEGAGAAGFGPGKAVFCGIHVLLQAAQSVSASYDALVKLFEMFAGFLDRLKSYVEPPCNVSILKIVAKTMAAMLSVIALATKYIKGGWLKNFWKAFLGNRKILDALGELDRLTNEELLTVVAQTHKDAAKARSDIQQMLTGQEAKTREDSRIKLWKWLSPPNVSTDHELARGRHHPGTARWFLRDDLFEVWRREGSLFWISGKPGSGKTILSFAIIEELSRQIPQDGESMVAYFYFSFQDTGKHSLRNLLSSLVMQLSLKSDVCYDVLAKLYESAPRLNGSEHPDPPTTSALSHCLREMLELPGQTPKYIIVDALDECPASVSASGSLRNETLKFITELIVSRIDGLRVCVTSRREDDIRAALETLASGQMVLENQAGQAIDIDDYIHSTIESSGKMRKWSKSTRDEVFNVLSSNADGMFRYVSCQLDTLCNCPLVAVRTVLKSLPRTLQGTYEDTLSRIDEDNWKHAHRIFQCLSFSSRPLLVEELAEVLAVDFDMPIPVFDKDLRISSAEEAVLSTCPGSFIAIAGEGHQRVVQFAHFSVKEFITSDYIADSERTNVRRFQVLAGPAHTILAKACLGVLLHIDIDVDKEGIRSFPLAPYAAQHWPDHARYGEVSRHVMDAMKVLFDPSKHCFKTWVWIHNHDMRFYHQLHHTPQPPDQSPLYYAIRCGITQITDYLVESYPEDVHRVGGFYGTCLYAASTLGYLEVVRTLLGHHVDINARGDRNQAPLHIASQNGHATIVQLLLERDASVDIQDYRMATSLEYALHRRHFDVARLLLEHHADANVVSHGSRTLLHWASSDGPVDAVRLLLEYGANVNARDYRMETPLHYSLDKERLDVTRLLLDSRADVNAQNHLSRTPLHIASSKRHLETVRLLLEYGASIDAEDQRRETPLEHAFDRGHFDIVQLMFNHHMNADRANHSYPTPLHHASSGGRSDIVLLLLEYGGDVDCKNGQGETPLHCAVHLGHLGIVRLLLKRHADVNVRDHTSRMPLHIAWSTGNLEAVRMLLEHGANVNVQDDQGETLLHHALHHGHLGVARLLLEHHADVNARDHTSRMPLHIAWSNGSLKAVRMLLEYGANVNVQDDQGETLLHHALHHGHLDVARLLLKHHADVNARDHTSRTPLHLASRLHHGHLDVAQLLLKHHAYVNARDHAFWSSLHLAPSKESLKAVQMLLEYSANVNVQDDQGETPLHLALQQEDLDVARLLLKYDADVNVQDHASRTPLHLASSRGNLEAIRMLLDHGASINVQDHVGKTPLHCASDRGCSDAVRLLLEHHADVNARDLSSSTALHFALGRGDFEAVQILLEYGEKRSASPVMSTRGEDVDGDGRRMRGRVSDRRKRGNVGSRNRRGCGVRNGGQREREPGGRTRTAGFEDGGG